MNTEAEQRTMRMLTEVTNLFEDSEKNHDRIISSIFKIARDFNIKELKPILASMEYGHVLYGLLTDPYFQEQ